MRGKAATTDQARQLRAAWASDVGLQRDHNEDAVLCYPDLGLFAVIDGVGGALAGETSSRLAAEVLLERLSERRTEHLGQRLEQAIVLANNRILEAAQRDEQLRGMACVLTAAVVDGDRLHLGHVGDTRLYRISAQGTEKLTRDHSPIGSMEDRGEIPELEAMHHPRRNEIFRDVGTARHFEGEDDFADIAEVDFGRDQAILLCTDGLTDQVTLREIRRIIEQHAGDPRSAVDELVDKANAAGGRDNTSVVLIEGEDFSQRFRPRPVEITARLRARPVAGEPAAGSRRAPTRPSSRKSSSPSIAPSSSDPTLRRPKPIPERYGAASHRSGTRAWALVVLAAVAGAVALATFLPERWRPAWLPKPPTSVAAARVFHKSVVRVGSEGDFQTIRAALQASRRGQRIEVEPGEYGETLVLREGVELVSRVPLQAVLRLESRGSDQETVAILAQGIRRGLLSGLRIRGQPGTGATVGLRLVESEIVVENVEIEGASGAAIEIRKGDRSTLRYNHLHDNPGTAIRVYRSAAPRILNNVIATSGGAEEPALDILEGAAPLVAENRFESNAVHVRAPTTAAPDQIRLSNQFSGDPQAAVQPALKASTNADEGAVN